ncbi:MAG TPA: rhomboid family intramembrane serine protease [Myxococcaceae bacterium]|nr:rhomboid family intramembrane serine protease [Myxococcaceae bacterium]
MTIRDRQVLTPDPSSRPVTRERAPPPIVSGGVIALSVLRYLLDVRQHTVPWALYGPAVQAGDWWRLLLYAFEHGNLLHILFNMSVVWTLGIPLERILGSWRFLIISLATCLGSAAVALFFAFDQPMVGASGMILGWAGVMLPISTRAGRRQLGVWLVQVAIISFLPHVSWQGHLGGFLFGLPFGFALRGGPRVFSYLAPALLACAAAIALVAGRLVRF